MQLYFTTGKLLPLQPQPNNMNSLGGMVSTTLLPNASLNSLFNGISLFTLKENTKDTYCIMMKNDLVDAINIKIYFDALTATSLEDYLLNITGVNYDGSGNPYVEIINSSKALPFGGTFVTAYTLANALVVPSMLANKYIAIWIQRKANMSLINTYFSNTQIEARFDKDLNQQTTTNLEQINLNISWE